VKQKRLVLFTVLFIVSALLSGCAGNNQTVNDEQELTYSVRTDLYEFSDDELYELLFSDILDSFEPDIWDFMVLEPSMPIDDSIYIQVGVENYEYDLQLGFYYEESGYSLYRLHTMDREVVLNYIVDYWQNQRIPDISSWEDMSAEIWG